MTTFALKATLDELMRSNVIDSRDLVERQTEIEGDLETLRDEGIKSDEEAEDEQELQDELDLLNELIEYIDGYSGDNAKDGVTLIAESYFEDDAREYADDIGAIDRDANWPTNHIDWEAAADDLKQDYTSVQIGSEEYWFR